MTTTQEQFWGRLREWDDAAWCLAATSLALRGGTDAVTAGARDVLQAVGLDADAATDPSVSERLGAQARSPLLQTAALLDGGSRWSHQSDEALLAQGRASAQSAGLLATTVLPRMHGLAERFAAPGARMLDVGVGVAAMAIAFCELFPQLSVIGLDVFDRALALAREAVDAAGLTDRIDLRLQDVAEFGDVDDVDFAWLPAPFVPEDALRAAVPAIARALRQGGWLMIGHGRLGDDPLERALTRFKTLAYGGTPLDDAAARMLLADAGLADIARLDTPPGAPALTVGRRAT